MLDKVAIYSNLPSINLRCSTAYIIQSSVQFTWSFFTHFDRHRDRSHFVEARGICKILFAWADGMVFLFPCGRAVVDRHVAWRVFRSRRAPRSRADHAQSRAEKEPKNVSISNRERNEESVGSMAGEAPIWHVDPRLVIRSWWKRTCADHLLSWKTRKPNACDHRLTSHRREQAAAP